MFAIRLAARTLGQAACTLPKTPRALPTRQLPLRSLQQKRYATYQRFPGKGGQQPYSNFEPVRRVQYVWRNYRTAIVVVGGTSGVVYVVNLEEVPVSHRRRFNIISPENEKQILGDSGYQQMLQELRGKILPPEHPYTQLVAKVVERLLPSTGGLAGDEWVVHVIDDPKQMNAFVMPGGKVFVFTGILPICQDEDGVATVLSHEIAHNVAHHVAERLSRSVFILPAAIATSLLFDISGSLSNSIIDLILSLPNSRTQETEADHLGLLMMAESCYDPKTAVNFWSRMKEAQKGAPPQFLSTHPSDYNRIEAIRKWLPDAESKYQSSECYSTSRNARDFVEALGGQQPFRRSSPPPSPSKPPQRDEEDFW